MRDDGSRASGGTGVRRLLGRLRRAWRSAEPWRSAGPSRSDEEDSRAHADGRLAAIEAALDPPQAPELCGGFDELLRSLPAKLRASLRADTATILLLQEDGLYLSPVASDGHAEGVGDDVAIPVGRGVAGRIAVSDPGLIVDDVTAVEVISPRLRGRLASLVGAPLRTADRLVGVIYVGSRSARRFREDDLVFLRLAADRIALAVAWARRAEAERQGRAAAEARNRERDERLARLGHELRNPLFAITNAVSVLDRSGAEAASAARAREVIGRQVTLLARVVEELLDLGRRTTTIPRPPVERPASSPAPAEGAVRRVVIVEDDADARDGLRRLLELSGHEVHGAANGHRGVELVREVRPEIVVVDIGLPGNDGYEVARRIRSIPEGRDIRLVALTGYGFPRDRERARAAGFDLHLVKPIDADRLAEILDVPTDHSGDA